MSPMDIVSTKTFMEERIPNIYKFCSPTLVSTYLSKLPIPFYGFP